MPLLAPPDRTLLLRALSQSPLFGTVRARQVLLRNTLGGYPNSDAIFAIFPLINLEDSPFIAADNVILYLDGQPLAPGVFALGLLAQAIEPFAGPLREPLTELRRRLLLGEPAIPSQPAATWQDHRSATDLTHERIIGENTLRPLFYLRRALRAADGCRPYRSRPHPARHRLPPRPGPSHDEQPRHRHRGAGRTRAGGVLRRTARH